MPGIVGREAELAAVDGFLAEACAGHSALLLEGEAGIGKTTLWREARRRAEARGARVLSCRPSAAEAKMSFGSVADLLAPIEEHVLAALPEPQREALEVALLRAPPRRGAPLARAAAAGFLALLRTLSADGPLVLAIDDAQWLDPPSRGVLEYAARRLEREPVGVLYAWRSRPEGAPIDAPPAEERVHRLVLGPLPLPALGRLVSDRIGRPLPRPTLARIARASSGNPFYALEIARLVSEHGEPAPGESLPVPDDVRAATAARIRRLPEDTRDALLLAAVLSVPDADTVDLAALAPAEERGIVTVAADGRIEFSHPLLAAAVYGASATSRRQALHRRAAALVSDPEQRARHLALASAQASADLAAELDHAAEHAARRGAPDAGAALAELAAERTPRGSPADRAGRLVAAARLHFEAGDLARASELVQRALAGSPPPAMRARALQLSSQLQGRRSNFGEAAELATAALAAAGDDARLRAAIELDVAYCSAGLGDFGGAATRARAALPHAHATGDSGLLAETLAAATMTGFLNGAGLARDDLEQALTLEDPLGGGSLVMRPSYISGLLQLWTGELEAALATLGALRDEVVERGQEGIAPLLFLYLVWACLWRGELRDAGRFATEAREAAALLEDPTASAIALAAAALVHAHDGRTRVARAEAEAALGVFESLQWRTGVIWPLWALGLAELSEDNPAAVDAALGPLAELLAGMGAGDPVLAVFLPDEIEALIALGELERAERHLEPFERKAEEFDRAWAKAAAARCRGALFAARGEREQALAAFDRAIAEHGRTDMPIERARTLLVAGRVRRRAKQRALARAALTEALALFERAEAPLWAVQARAELARLGRPAATPDGLTPTERRLAELVAAGLSNREVAERAFVSVKTVEANLTRIYRKLGVRSRAGLAAAFRDGDFPLSSPARRA